MISFCDRVAFNIKSSDTKDAILAQLESFFNVKILQKHWYPVTENTVSQVYKAPHLACLRSNGNPYFMYLSTYEDVPIIYFIDKKVHPGYQKPRIILGRGMFDESLFVGKGTILDGEMVKDKNGQWLFLINDVIGFKSHWLKDVPLPKRLAHAYGVLQAYTPDPTMDFCTFQVKQYSYASREGITALTNLAQDLPYTNRGVYVWPFFMQLKPKLCNFDDTVIKEVYRKVKDNPEFREMTSPSPPALPAPPQSQPQLQKQQSNHVTPPPAAGNIMWLRKTENPDVYDVYTNQTQTSKAGIAHVPSLSLSKKLRNTFKDLTVTMSIPFTCSYNTTFEKYQPIEVAVEHM
jgi:hypothetical protein